MEQSPPNIQHLTVYVPCPAAFDAITATVTATATATATLQLHYTTLQQHYNNATTPLHHAPTYNHSKPTAHGTARHLKPHRKPKTNLPVPVIPRINRADR